MSEVATPLLEELSPEALRAAAEAELDVDLSGCRSSDEILAARVDAELDRCDGLLFTATPREDLLEVARWQRLEDQAWCGRIRHVVAATYRMTAEERDFAGDEMALALGVSPGSGRALVWLAGEVAALPGLLEAVEGGRIARSHLRAAMDVLQTSALTLEQRQAVVLIALARYRDQTPGDWARVVRRLVLSLDPEGGQRRKDERTAGRQVRFYPLPDEQAGMSLEAPLEAVARVEARIDAEARRLKAAGDERTMDQLRCDVSLALLADGRLDGLEPAAWSVSVVVPLSVLEDADAEATEAAEIPGWGPILPSTARDLARRAAEHAGSFSLVAVDRDGSVVAVGDPVRVPVDKGRVLGTGDLVPPAPGDAPLAEVIRAMRRTPVVRDLESSGYRPSTRLLRLLEARDRRCVFPGCPRPAGRTDKDHRVPWPRGRTTPDNLQCVCRHHHRAKHATFTVDLDADGSVVWTTRAGWWFRRRPEGS